ncbi:MAG: polyprenol monophosphomannose synthase [Anaerolineales bacterium]|nr:polyprenol monophosphomannose synthase [Anaerolineales bacterium]MCW5856584.1 polyprenol monophosphomannose synthase [Anaerolineales bacterium]
MRITLVLPTYNEVENLPKLLPVLMALPLPGLRVLVVDDLSPDGSGQIAEQLAAEYPGRIEVLHRRGPRGLGSAYSFGFDHALRGDAEAIAQMDCDFSHPPEKLPEMVAKLADCDLVQGSRYVPGGGVDENWPVWRKALSRWANLYARTILRLPVNDVTGAFRLWRRSLLERVPYQQAVSNGYIFLVEILYLAKLQGARFGEVPIYFADRQFGTSKMNLRVQLEAALRVWQMVWHYRARR